METCQIVLNHAFVRSKTFFVQPATVMTKIKQTEYVFEAIVLVLGTSLYHFSPSNSGTYQMLTFVLHK